MDGYEGTLVLLQESRLADFGIVSARCKIK